jgi:hypothetical protein
MGHTLVGANWMSFLAMRPAYLTRVYVCADVLNTSLLG